MHKLFAILLLLILLVAGCNDQGPVASNPYALWKAHALQNYTVDQERQCFCPYEGAVRITVHANQITSVIRLSDSSETSAERYLTIDSLFSIALNPGTDSVAAVFNEVYGYPEILDINPQQHPADGGVLYRTSNLQTQ